MQLFVKSEYCSSRTRCGTCRSQQHDGRQWRLLMSRMFGLPDRDFDCPFGARWGDKTPPTPPDAKMAPATMPVAAISSHATFTELHGRVKTYQGDAIAEMAFLSGLLPRLIGGCGCREHYVGYLTDHPPALENAPQYAHWQWGLHNAVNQRRKIPEMSWDEAAEIHGW